MRGSADVAFLGLTYSLSSYEKGLFVAAVLELGIVGARGNTSTVCAQQGHEQYDEKLRLVVARAKLNQRAC
jgi:hypothetical protein